MTSKTLRLSDGAKVSYRAAGHGTPVVLLHGVGMQSAAWIPQINALSESHLEEISHQGYAQAYQVFAESDALYADRLAAHLG